MGSFKIGYLYRVIRIYIYIYPYKYIQLDGCVTSDRNLVPSCTMLSVMETWPHFYYFEKMVCLYRVAYSFIHI